ncbi:hypothetical protein DdX_13209 [Ditylenchus destructor]|uniref:MYND-type domain-containing protein n=1 Tax=Ditylenchus destructor TaxID=166010 RepID=A0AAD4MX84_9BILA|nr:hypothetical protein DdX_13209 [Ditylenchus destructor]
MVMVTIVQIANPMKSNQLKLFSPTKGKRLGIGKGTDRDVGEDYEHSRFQAQGTSQQSGGSKILCAQCHHETGTTVACDSCNSPNIVYCSMDCKRVNFFTHKYFCGLKPETMPDQKAQYAINSGQRYVLGILLRDDNSKPKFVDVLITKDNVPESEPHLHNRRIDGGYSFDIAERQRDRCWRSRRLFGHILKYYVRTNFSTDGSNINECAVEITQGRSVTPWRGAILVVKFQNGDWVDIEIKDGNDIVEQCLFDQYN